MKQFFKSLGDFYRLSFSGLAGIVSRPFYFQEFLDQLTYAGPDTLVITVITAFVVGMALSVQVLFQFEGLGLENEVGGLIGTAVIREIIPITLALLFAGRVGSGISAELAGMRQREQIDTIRAFGVNPVKMLVTPRIASCILMLPSLTLIGDFSALFGGFFITGTQFHTDPAMFWSSVRTILNVKNMFAGIIKPLIFGYLIGVISCYVGLNSKGGSTGLKRSATQAYVLSTVSVMITDFLIIKVIWILFP
jgi:phospholipid/cholesterol/gamma-HCH transport system permease protein